jgi:hypothetical protein
MFCGEKINVGIQLFFYSSSSRWQWSRQMCSRTPCVMNFLLLREFPVLIFIEGRLRWSGMFEWFARKVRIPFFMTRDLACLVLLSLTQTLSFRDLYRVTIFLNKIIGNCFKPSLNVILDFTAMKVILWSSVFMPLIQIIRSRATPQLFSSIYNKFHIITLLSFSKVLSYLKMYLY